ncbi:hypothetical protein QF030_000129 [Streptomyces rishiriensis]|uniref:Uncharacterized protein n=1 Tax=Streptomyces rishiriensis TaxID=68264 RepID=A0ABU0NFS9_STRRH|nr:hypothetical protein [Streptomyces rishiriensis]
MPPRQPLAVPGPPRHRQRRWLCAALLPRHRHRMPGRTRIPACGGLRHPARPALRGPGRQAQARPHLERPVRAAYPPHPLRPAQRRRPIGPAPLTGHHRHPPGQRPRGTGRFHLGQPGPPQPPAQRGREGFRACPVTQQPARPAAGPFPQPRINQGPGHRDDVGEDHRIPDQQPPLPLAPARRAGTAPARGRHHLLQTRPPHRIPRPEFLLFPPSAHHRTRQREHLTRRHTGRPRRPHHPRPPALRPAQLVGFGSAKNSAGLFR